jgi:hypothetical protein
MVVEVLPPIDGGSFHAKTWLLRFVGEDSRVIYRFICLSRNLTPDRSWDTALVLDGILTDRQRAITKNHPLGNFVASLLSFAQRKLPASRRHDVELLSQEVRRVKFEPPPYFNDFAFWPLGLTGTKRFSLQDHGSRLLIVSPFLSEGILRHHTDTSSILVSRPESLVSVNSEILKRFAAVYVLDDAAVEEESDENSEVDSPRYSSNFRGLHAKLFIADQGWYASVWTGSANATNAAFERNIEFLVELRGKKSKVGIEAFLGGEENGGFSTLLSPFLVGEQQEHDNEVEANEQRAEDIRRNLARAGLRLRVESGGEIGNFDLVLLYPKRHPLNLDGVRARCWPVAVNKSLSRDLTALSKEDGLRFRGLTLNGVTSFMAFEVITGAGPKAVSIRFVLNLPLDGAPKERLEHLLKDILGDKERLLRYLLFLLARDADVAAIGSLLLSQHEKGFGDNPTNGAVIPLFEELIRALARSPEKLDSVERLVEDLRRTADGAALLPEGFDLLWKAIWIARTGVNKESNS